MKQRLLLALLMVFASVGLAMGQSASIDITIPGNSAGGQVLVEVSGSNIQNGQAPEATATGLTQYYYQKDGKMVAQYAVPVTDKEQVLSFTNGTNESGVAWISDDLEMEVVGQVSSFVINGKGALTNHLTSLVFSGNGILQNLVLGSLEGGVNKGWIGYVPALKTLDCSNNQLSVLPAKTNAPDGKITITDYDVSGQSPQIVPTLSTVSTTDHKFSISTDALDNICLKDIEDYELSNCLLNGEPVSLEGDSNDGYTLKQNGIFVGGTFTATLTVAATDTYYPGASLQVNVSVEEPTFKATAKGNDTNGTVSVSPNEGLKVGDEVTVSVNPKEGYEVTSIEFAGLSKDANQTEINGTYTVVGDVDPSVSVTFSAIVVDKYTVYTSKNSGGTVELYEGNSAIGMAHTFLNLEANTNFSVKVTPKKGYLLEKVIYNKVSQTIPAVATDGSYTFTSIQSAEVDTPFEVFFKRGATITRMAFDAEGNRLVGLAPTVTFEGQEAKDMTLNQGDEISFTPGTHGNYAFDHFSVNGKVVEGSTAKVVAGTNNVVAHYTSTVATVDKFVFGIANQDAVTVSEVKKAGDEISVTIADDKLGANEKINAVYINGTLVSQSPYKATAVAGKNTVVVYADVAPTLSKTVTGIEQVTTERVSIKNAGDQELSDGASLTAGETLTILVNNIDGFTVTATFNGEPLKIGEGNEVTVKGGTNYFRVIYTKDAPAQLPAAATIVPEGAGTAELYLPGNGWIGINTHPNQGYGLAYVEVNGGKSQVNYNFLNNPNAAIAVALPGENTVTVVFTNKSTVSKSVEAGEGDGAPSATNVTVTTEDGKTVEANQTLEPGTTIKISATTTTGYEVKSISVNGTALQTNTTGDNTWAETTLAVGNNHVVVLYDDMKGKEFKVIAVGDDTRTFKDSDVTYYKDGSSVQTNTLVAGDEIQVKLNTNNAIQRVYFNNDEIVAQSNGNYGNGKVQAGENTLYVFFDDAAVVKTLVVGEGVASVEVKKNGVAVDEDDFLDPGDDITITATAESGYTLGTIWHNGTEVTGTTCKVESGLNLIVVEASKNPTIAKTIIGEGTGSLDADDLISVITQNLTVGSSVEFTVTETSGDFQVKAVYFNGVKVEPQGGEYAGTIAAGTNYITVEYVSTAIGNIKVNVIAEEGGKATYKLNEKNRTVTVTTTPNSGYGVESVVANGGNSQVITKTANKTYTFTAQPGDNTVQVYFTQQALVSAQVLGAESSADDIAVKNGNNPVSLIGSTTPTTLEIGTTITITVNNEKEGYKLTSVTVNGKSVGEGTLSEDGKSKTYTYEVEVGENHIVATYESTKATEVKEIVVGGEADVKYHKESAEITDFSTLTDGTAIDIEIEAETPNTFRTAYFNNEMLEDENEDGKYEAEVRKGENTLYVFLNDAAAIVANESENGTVKFTQSGAEVGIDAKLNEGSNVNVSIEPVEGYEIARVYYNGQLVEDVANGEFDVTVQSGLNVVHVEYNQLPELNVEWDANAGSVTWTPKKDLTTGQEVTFTVKPNESTGFLFAQFYHNGKLISDDNEDGKYEITLVAGENNVYVKFSAEVEGHMLVKYDEQTTETTTKVTNVVISELKGDKTWSPDNGEYIDVPAATLLKVTFQVPDIKNGNVDGIVSAVINGQNYAPLTADADGVYTIGQADLANDRIVLPEGESVLRIYVKTRTGITINPTLNGYVYDGNEKAIEFTTKPASIKNDPNLKISYAYDGSDEWTVTPLEAGNYKVRFEREADDQYSAYRKDFEFTIDKAPLVITQLPEVTLEQPGQNNSPLVVSGGAVGYWSNGSYITIDGEFTTTDTHTKGEKVAQVSYNWEDQDDNLDYTAVSGYLYVNYKPNEQTKYYSITTDASEVPTFRLIKGGNTVVNSMDYLEGTDAIAMAYDVVPGYKYTLYQVDENGDETPVVDPEDGFTVAEVCNNDAPNATLVLRAEELPRLGVTGTTDNVFEIKTKPVYDSYPHPFKPTKDNLPLMYGENNKRVEDQAVYDKLVVTYTDANGNMIIEPVNAGTYTVTVSYAADDKYQDFTATAEYTIEKRKLDDLYIKDPVASPLAAGLTLENSTLLGAAEIPGNYKWEDPTNVPTADDDGGVNQHAYFEPIDTQNFGNHRDVGTVRVRILDGVQVVSAHSNYGKVLVKDQTGTALNMPASVAAGEKLTVSAVNTDPTLLELESITVTMIVNGKETTTTISDGATITFPEEGNVEIEATFKLKDNSSTIVVPDGQRAVVMPKSVRGAKLSKTGVYTVDYGESFTFTVSTLEADKDKVVVSVNGTTIQPANGVYTISNITEQQNVSVSLTSKTEVKVDIQKEYKLKDGTLIGRVTVVNNTSNDGKFYYNDELTLVAEPVKGVTFSAWSDGNKEDVRKYAIASSEVKLTASFSGVPTGIEDIESAQILAGNECIWVKNVADANVTIVGMTGRIQAQQQISGDTQIRVPAGIYVVVLENGKDVKQVKVIVR